MNLKGHMTKWKRRLALLLAVAVVCDLRVIRPLAGVPEEIKQTIWAVEELPEEIKNQQVELGTAKEALNLPEFLMAAMDVPEVENEGKSVLLSRKFMEGEATASEGIRKNATSSDSINEIWKQVSVTWEFLDADNGQTVYDCEVPGVYTFKAQLEDGNYGIENDLLPTVTVEVKKELPEVFGGGLTKFGPMEVSVMANFFNLDNNTVDLREGRFEKWIDRIDVPDYARSFYKALEESVDNDGNDDF